MLSFKKDGLNKSILFYCGLNTENQIPLSTICNQVKTISMNYLFAFLCPGIFKAGIAAVLLVAVFLFPTLLPAQPLLQRNVPTERSAGQTTTVIAVERDYELYRRIDAMQEEIQMLRGMMEEQGYALELMKRAERERFIDLDRRITQLSAAKSTMPVASGGFSSTIFDDEQAAYQKAKKRVDDKEYNAAIAEMSLYLEIFPEGQYVGHAHYWLGELYSALEIPEYDNSEKHFQIILKKYPQHPKVADTLFKLGALNEQQGKKAQAKSLFERLIKEHPSSSAAGLARSRLSAL
jgi:tol-pal system protein YbgF